MRRWFFVTALTVVLTYLPPAQSDDVSKGFEPLFNGTDLAGWKVHGGKMDVWGAENGILFVNGRGGGWLMTEKEYGDFELSLEYKLPVHGNSGVALRSPRQGDPAYTGMEIQVIDDANWKGLKPWQHTGSIYDVVPAAKQANKPIGEWNHLRIVAKGRQVTVKLNGETLVDADLDQHKEKNDKHPGLIREKGHLGLQSHDGRVEFRELFVKQL